MRLDLGRHKPGISRLDVTFVSQLKERTPKHIAEATTVIFSMPAPTALVPSPGDAAVVDAEVNPTFGQSEVINKLCRFY